MAEFADAMNMAVRGRAQDSRGAKEGLAAWLLDRWRLRTRKTARLAVAERINIGPRQSLCLIEVDGERLLLASSPEGTPAFYPLKTGTNS